MKFGILCLASFGAARLEAACDRDLLCSALAFLLRHNVGCTESESEPRFHADPQLFRRNRKGFNRLEEEGETSRPPPTPATERLRRGLAFGRPVEIQAGACPRAARSADPWADRIVIRQDGIVDGEHRRRFGRGETVYDPWHYVPVLARKPGRCARRPVQGLAAAGQPGAGAAQAEGLG
jgi:hypothetical protein